MPVVSIRSFRSLLKLIFNHQLCSTFFGGKVTVYDLLKRLGLVWISAGAVSPYAAPVAQAEFKKNFVQEVAAALPPGVAPEQVDA